MIATLPHHCYHDEAIYRHECEHLLLRHWWLIGPESDVAGPGDYLALNLLRRPLVIVRDREGELRGFYNLCRHRAGPLVLDGSGNCREFVCRYHGWRYACSGELLKTPGFAAGELGNAEDLGLLALRVASWNGLVFVCLDDAAADLRSWLGDVDGIASDFEASASMRYDGEARKTARCNWKTYGDNSCEGYHVGMVHRALGSSLQRETVNIDAYENGQFVGFDVSYGAGDDRSRAGKGFWIYKFPGLLLHFADYAFNAETVLPLAVDCIELRRWFWSHPERAGRNGVDTDSIRPNSERVMDEDIAICELVQRNLAAGVYPGGRLSPRQEPGTIYFQRLVRAALGDLLEP